MNKVILSNEVTGNYKMGKLNRSSKTITILTDKINSPESSDNYHLI